MNSKHYRFILSLVVSCTAELGYAQPSYCEKYGDVLDCYAANNADSLKYKAAMYLINNMDGHVSPEGVALKDYMCRINVMKKSNGIRQLQMEWNNAIKNGSVDYVPDSSVVTSSYLISNIEAAFDAWGKAAWKEDVTFEQFCEYILPYRINDEHIGVEWRNQLRRRYMSLIEGVDDIKKAFAIIKDTVNKAVVLSNDYCPYTLDPLTCHKIGRAECGQRCLVLVSVLRSLGIPAVIDYTPMWSDYSNKGHAWVAVVASNGDTYTVYENDKEAKRFNPVDASEFLYRYKLNESDHCPYTIKTKKTPVKIYRICFGFHNARSGSSTYVSPFLKDVSEQYGLTTDIQLDVQEDTIVYLCSYLSASDWMPIAMGKPKNGQVVFHHVGRGAVCVAAAMRNGKRVFLTNPFLVGNGSIEKWFFPLNMQKQSIQIDRKYPLCSYTTDTWGYMRGGTFEGSMTEDFHKADTLAVINTMPYGMTTIDVSTSRKYRYLYYRAPINNRSSLAELRFYGGCELNDQRLLQGSLFGFGVDTANIKKVFDGSASTICKGLKTGYTIGLNLGESEEAFVTKIEFCPSTDLNFVEPGHLYELYYFDMNWQLIGREYSNKGYLTFKDVPIGALLLLKDKTAGKEERIFEYIDGQQKWY